VVTDQEELANLAENLRLHLAENCWSQLDLAHASGVPQYTISRILHAKCDPSLSAVSRLSRALKTGIDRLLSAPPRKKLRNVS
jgi:transcriptional regulator with XRE-family HTH domain